MSEIDYTLILLVSFFAVASPGPATLAIASASMSQGRLKGASLAAGITTGSLIWWCAAALGLSAIMYANVWLFETIRYLGSIYLLYMAFQSAKAVVKHQSSAIKEPEQKQLSVLAAYSRGAAIHLTNPKAILFFASIYAIAIPQGTSLQELLIINGLIVGQGVIVFQTYAFVFSIKKMRKLYVDLRRWFEAFFAAAFGLAGLKVLTLDV